MKHYPLIMIGLLLFSATTLAVEKTSPKHIDDGVRQRTQKMLPYALDETLQTFTKTVHGGVQHVVSKSPDNTEQIKLIQAHLFKTTNEFKRGDFSVTERMHGPNMPGLAQLKLAKPDDIKYEYKALENGAQIHYSTEYPQFVQALHEWFEAQASEHGSNVIPGHNQHHATPAD